VLMHMPRKPGVLVMIVVAVCVGAYYVFVVQSAHVGGWRVYQGTARLHREAETGLRYLDVGYTVRYADEPLFACVRPRITDDPAAVTFDYQSEWPSVLLVVVAERDGSCYQARVELPHAETWERARLDARRFSPRKATGNADENGRLDFDQLSSRVVFYDGAGVTRPSTAFTNRLKLTVPVLARGAAGRTEVP